MIEDEVHRELQGEGTGAAPRAELPAHLVIYDGECGLCDATVQRLLRWDSGRLLRYAPNQGETFARMRARWPDAEPQNTVYFLDSSGSEPRLYARSEAIFRIAALLPWPWRAARWLLALPRWLTDAGYRLVARYRIAIWGRVDACRMPSKEERALFLP